MRDKLDWLPCLSWGFMGSPKEGRDLRGPHFRLDLGMNFANTFIFITSKEVKHSKLWHYLQNYTLSKRIKKYYSQLKIF